MLRPCPIKRKGIIRALNALHYVSALSACRIEINGLKIGERFDILLLRKAIYELAHLVLQRGTARHDNADADRTFGVKPLKILKVAIKEWAEAFLPSP